MKSRPGRIQIATMTGVIGVALLLASQSGRITAQQSSGRPTVTATILLREKDTVTLNRGQQDGLRKGDKLRAVHYVNGQYFTTGTLELIKVYNTTSIARITEQSGALGTEDNAVFELTTPAPATPARSASPAPAAPTRSAAPAPSSKSAQNPAATASAGATKPAPATISTQDLEATRKTEVALPLLPAFSSDKTAGAAFSLDFTNDGDKVLDTSAFRLSARLTFDGQDYRTPKTTLTGNYNLAPGKTRTFTFNLTDFTIAGDSDVWPLKAGRHTVVIRFGGKQYGPVTFQWNAGSSPMP
jgi:hypothetical protein